MMTSGGYMDAALRAVAAGVSLTTYILSWSGSDDALRCAHV